MGMGAFLELSTATITFITLRRKKMKGAIKKGVVVTEYSVRSLGIFRITNMDLGMKIRIVGKTSEKARFQNLLVQLCAMILNLN